MYLSFNYFFWLVLALSCIPFASAYAVAQDLQTQSTKQQNNVAVSVYMMKNGQEVRLDYPQPPQLLQVYQSAAEADLLPATPYWPSSRLVSLNKQLEVTKQQQKLVVQLNALASHWQKLDKPELASSASKVAKQVATWPLIGAEFIGRLDTAVSGIRQSGINTIEPTLYASIDQVRLSVRTSINNNPYLPAGSYNLLISPDHAEGAAPQWHVVGAVEQIIKAPYIAALSVREMTEEVRLSEFRLPGASKSYLWQMNLAGSVKQIPVAYYNAVGDIAIMGGIWVLGFEQSQLPEEYKQINEQLAQLAKYWNVTL